MRVDRVLSCFTVTIIVFFFKLSAFGQSQCQFIFDKTAYEKIYLPSAGQLISKNNYKDINKLADGVYNFIVLENGSLQIGQKFHGSSLYPTQTLASHKSLYNGYAEASKALHKKPDAVVAAGKLILINKQVSQISNLNFDYKSLNPKSFISLITEFKNQGVSINSLTRVKLYSTTSLESSRFQEQVKLREMERAHVMSLKNQNPELALLWMNAKQFYRQLYALFPSQKTAGTLDLAKLQAEIGPLLSNQQKQSLFLEIMQFLKSVESEGILLSVYKKHKTAQESNPIEQFRDTTNYFLKLIENYKYEKSKQENQLEFWFTD
ncbi:MAG: hypothetical protein MK008_03375 [Bdellovibrionales bacterium]|nr:hypothetical protein [Bdellovibrionales bacterium]